MPEKKTVQRARRARRQGKAATTAAGEFVGEEMRHSKRGKHPVKNRKQAIAIGLSKARRAGFEVPPRSGRRTAKGSSPSQSARTARAKTLARKGGAAKKKGAKSTKSRSRRR
jgi:hypothetical protein